MELKIPIKSLAYVGMDNKWHLEQGEFSLTVQKMKVNFSVNKTIIW